MEDGHNRTDHKATAKWAWPGSRDLISKFWDPLISYERIEQSASNLVRRWRTDPSCVGNIKRPLNGSGLGYVTQFRNFGTPNNFWTKRAIRFKFGTGIEDGPSLRTDHKTTHKWAWPGSRDLFQILGPHNNFRTNWAIRFKFGTEMEDVASLRKGVAWVTWPNFKILGPLIFFEQIELSAANLVYKWRTDPSSVQTINWVVRVVVDLLSHDICKTANVDHRRINNDKTANIKDKNLKIYNDV